MANPQQIYSGLLARGFSPVQASALLGNMQQESGFNPTQVNPKEGAFGLIQWRQDRLQNLYNFAEGTGRSANDPDVQMDFLKHEMQGSEAGNSGAFLGATDVASANAGLKPYIRYGDSSQGTRLQNAQQLAQKFNGSGSLGQAAAPAGTGSLGAPAASWIPPDATAEPPAPNALSGLALYGALAQKPKLTPVDYDPFRVMPQLTPIEHDPFQGT